MTWEITDYEPDELEEDEEENKDPEYELRNYSFGFARINGKQINLFFGKGLEIPACQICYLLGRLLPDEIQINVSFQETESFNPNDYIPLSTYKKEYFKDLQLSECSKGWLSVVQLLLKEFYDQYNNSIEVSS